MEDSTGYAFALGVLVALILVAAVSGILFGLSQARTSTPRRSDWNPDLNTAGPVPPNLPADKKPGDEKATPGASECVPCSDKGPPGETGVPQSKWPCPEFDISEEELTNLAKLWPWCNEDYKPAEQAKEQHCHIMWLLWTIRIVLEPFKKEHSVLSPNAVVQMSRGTLGLKVPLYAGATGCAGILTAPPKGSRHQKVIDYLLTFLRLRVFRDFEMLVMAHATTEHGCGLIEAARVISATKEGDERRKHLRKLFGNEPLIDEWLDYENLVEAAYKMVCHKLGKLSGAGPDAAKPMPFSHWIWQVRVEMARAFCCFLQSSKLSTAPLPFPLITRAIKENPRLKYNEVCTGGFAVNGYADVLSAVLKGRAHALNEDIVAETKRAVYRAYFLQGFAVTPDEWEIYFFVGSVIIWPVPSHKMVRYIHIQETPHSKSIVRHDGYMGRMLDKNYLVGFRVDDDPNDFMQFIALDGFAPNPQFAGVSNALFGWQTCFESFEVGQGHYGLSARPTYLVLDPDATRTINDPTVKSPAQAVGAACAASYVKLIKAVRGAPDLQGDAGACHAPQYGHQGPCGNCGGYHGGPHGHINHLLEKACPPAKVIKRSVFDMPAMTPAAPPFTPEEERAKNRLIAHPHAGMELFLK